MVRVIKGTTGRSTSDEYLKSRLFDYLADSGEFYIGTEDPHKVVGWIKELHPVFDIDDVIDRALDEGISIIDAIEQLGEELANMV